MIKISGFTDEISFKLDAQLKTLKELGENYMCPRSVDGENISDISYDTFMSDIKGRLTKQNIKFSSIGSPIGKVKLEDEKGYLAQIDKLKELVKIAKAMDCKYIRVFSFFVDPNGDYEKYFPVVVEKMKGFLKIVEGTDIILLHENEKQIFGDTPQRVLRLYKELNHPSLALCYDASNYIQCNCDPFDAYNMTKEFTVYYHMKDCIDGVEVPLGIGQGRIQEIISDLVKNGYDGFLTLEPHTLKYALLKRFVYIFPIKKFKRLRKVYELIDSKNNISKFQKVTRKQVYLWQYNNLKEILKKAGV
jgi:sugar phosphate isomerase/epimerase